MINKSIADHEALKLVEQGGYNLAPRLAAVLGVSSQAANLRVRDLVDRGWVLAEGKTRARQYRLATLAQAQRSFATAGLTEDAVWSDVFAPALADLPANVRSMWQYGITEMANNAIEHSGAQGLVVSFRRTALHTEAHIGDDGVGIFAKIQGALGLADPREAILELAKGKLTTDPEHHPGEGIFFTSKVFDEFDIISGRLHFRHDGQPWDVLVDHGEDLGGTLVALRLENQSLRTTQRVFDRFAEPDALSFDRTLVPVKLAMYEGSSLVSRSQARRLYSRFERFKHVILDFKDVDEIGQAFADELFRVFAKAHPHVVLAPLNMTPAVDQMVRRALAAKEEQ